MSLKIGPLNTESFDLPKWQEAPARGPKYGVGKDLRLLVFYIGPLTFAQSMV